jgi:hypothetical protein
MKAPLRNKCCSLTIGEKDLTELAFAGLTPVMWDKMDGQDLTDVNQLLQLARMHENRAKDAKHHADSERPLARRSPA